MHQHHTMTFFFFNITVKGPNFLLKTEQKASPVKQAKDFYRFSLEKPDNILYAEQVRNLFSENLKLVNSISTTEAFEMATATVRKSHGTISNMFTLKFKLMKVKVDATAPCIVTFYL